MTLNWRKKEYFRLLLIGEADEAHGALELLVDDLHKDKPRTVSAFLDHCGSEDFIWGLVAMLRHENTRVAGNSAYILGTLAEHHVGQARVLGLINGLHTHTILADLCNMLDHDDSESVMNAAGTLGTLAETTEGRAWMFKDQCINSMISKVMMLLSSENMWTASNAALVLARLSISEDGCQHLLHHRQSKQLLTRLIQSLGVDEAGKGMNVAFAVGRICDTQEGRTKLIQHQDIAKMISVLSDMLSSKDPGCGKNACFAISCLAGNQDGHALLLNHLRCDVMLRRLAQQLYSSDLETSWFAAMTLRTLASQKKGCIALRDHAVIVPALMEIDSAISQDLHDEVELTLELLKKLDKPNPPVIEVKGPREVMVAWDTVTLRSELEIIYKLYLDNIVLYKGTETSYEANNLKPNTAYTLKLQLTTEGDESPLSDPVDVTTQECVPDVPEALRVLAVSTSQIRIGWSPPGSVNGGLKGYVVYNGRQQVEVTTELCCTLSALTPSTKYDIHVCAFNHKGKGKKAWISPSTSELGKHAPGKPILNVRGRNEIHVTWSPPEFPLGRLHKFEISLNGKVIYSGTELCFTARRLVPNTDYTFKVIAVTSEGRCESEPAKKKTPKDEYNVQSTAPIFFSHPHKSQDQDTASRQYKQQCQLQSKSNRIRTPLPHKQRNFNSSPCEFTESRPSTGISSSESKSSSEEARATHFGDNKVIQNCALNNNHDDGIKNAAYGHTSSDHCCNKNDKFVENHVGHMITSESDDSTEDEQPPSKCKVVIRSKSSDKNSPKQISTLENQIYSSVEETARTHVGRSQGRGEHHVIPDEYSKRQFDDQRMKPRGKDNNDNHTVDRGSTTGLRSKLKGTTISDNFDDRTCVRSQTNANGKHVLAGDEMEQISRKYRGKPKIEADVQKTIPVASIKEGSADSVHYRERQHAFNKKYMEVKQRQFTDGDLELRKQEKKNRAFKGNTQMKKSARLQSLSLSQDLQIGVGRRGSNSATKYSPTSMSATRHRSESNLSEKLSNTRESIDSGFNGFVMSSNGTVIYSEGDPPSPRSKVKHSRMEQPIKEQMAVEEGKYMYDTLFKGKEPLSKRTPNLFPWEREGTHLNDSPYERYAVADNISKNIANLQKSYSKPVNWNSMIDPLHDKQSNSDRSAFYQRAHTFMSSHRPLLKKTLEKLPSQGPGSQGPGSQGPGSQGPGLQGPGSQGPGSQGPGSQGPGSTQMELPLPQHMSNNRYQFIPMQFRTQPLHMPGPPLHPGNPNGNLYDKALDSEEFHQRPSLPRSYTCPSLERAYVRRLEAMSYLSQKKQSGSQLQPCRPPAMRYSHRESPTIQVDSPKSQSSSGLLTDAAH